MEKLLDRHAVAELLGCSTTMLERLRNKGDFAKPLKFGVLVRWRAADVEAWLNQRLTDEESR